VTYQLSEAQLKKILKTIKEEQLRSQKSPSIRHLFTRLDKLRRNLFVSAGTVATFIIAGIDIKEVSVGVVRGNVQNSWIFGVSLTLIFVYYFYLYYLTHRKLESSLNLKKVLKDNYLYGIAIQLFVEILKNLNINYSPSLETKSDETISLTAPLIKNEISNYKSVLAEIEKEESLKLVRQEKLIFTYNITKKDEAVFLKNHRFLKQMDQLDSMDYKLPLWFASMVMVIIIVIPIFRFIQGNI
jgi:ribosomal protein S13